MKFDPNTFFSPDSRYAIYPIIHQGIISAPQSASHYKDLGFGGVVGNVPYTANFPGDEQEWKDTADGFRCFISKGMHAWIYDEKGYPSGTAGGTVIDENPAYIAEGLYCYEYWRTLTGPINYRADVPGDSLYRALLLPLDGGDPVDVTSSQNDAGTLHMKVPEGSYHLFTMSRRRLFDGTHAAESYSEPRNYISLNDKDAVSAFLRITHEGYARHLSDEFGKGILAFFTDEPSLISWNIRQGVYPIVPWHHTFPDAFLARYGYPIELAVSAVVTGRGPEKIRRRCDFWEFVADGVAENYFGTIQDWCHAHGLKSSGHMLEEERLSAHVINYGSLYRCMKRMDWPGIDQLDSEPQRLMERDKLPIARLIASFADINGEQEAFTEFSDHTSRMENKQIGMDWIYSSVNWHFAMGINNMTSYYNFNNFSDEEIRSLNLYTARLGYLLRYGKRASHVALLYPESTIWAAYTPTVAERARDFSPDTLKVENAFRDLSWELLERQIDFDYVDEDLINEAQISNHTLCYCNREYKSLILPAVRVLQKRTMEKLIKILDNGIGVIFMGELPSIIRETGEKCDFSRQLIPYYDKPGFYFSPELSLPGSCKISALLRSIRLTPTSLDSVLTGSDGTARIVDGEILSSFILSHTRITEDGTRIIFLTNMGGKTYHGELALSQGNLVQTADPATGRITEIPFTRTSGLLHIPVSLKPYEALIFIVA